MISEPTIQELIEEIYTPRDIPGVYEKRKHLNQSITHLQQALEEAELNLVNRNSWARNVQQAAKKLEQERDQLLQDVKRKDEALSAAMAIIGAHDGCSRYGVKEAHVYRQCEQALHHFNQLKEQEKK